MHPENDSSLTVLIIHSANVNSCNIDVVKVQCYVLDINSSRATYVAESTTTDCRMFRPCRPWFCYVFAQDQFAGHVIYTLISHTLVTGAKLDSPKGLNSVYMYSMSSVIFGYVSQYSDWLQVMHKEFLPLVMAFAFPQVQRRCVQQCRALIGREVARRMQHTVIEQCCTRIPSSSSPVQSCCEFCPCTPSVFFWLLPK